MIDILERNTHSYQELLSKINIIPDNNACGCSINVVTDLRDGTVVAVNGEASVVGELVDGTALLAIPTSGEWSVYAVNDENISDATKCTLVSSDNVELTFFEATVGCYLINNVSATVTCTNGTKTYTSTGAGLHTFTVYERGTWTVSCEIFGTTWRFSPNVQDHQVSYIDVFGNIDAALNNNDWDTISAVSSASIAHNFWAVGDTKQVIINGTVGQTTFHNLSVWAFILGFNHNSAKEGTGIHFQIGKTAQTGGKDVCLIDSKYDSLLSTTAGYFNMNYSSTNDGGWKSSKMRTTLLGNSNAPSSPLSGSLIAALPSGLRAVMKGVTKYSDNTGGGKNTASYVTSTTDYLWLLAEWEVFGTRSHANSAEQNYQAQYAYYANGNSKMKYRHSATSSTASWWLRSAYAMSSNRFCYVYTSGSVNISSTAYSRGVAPAFCV